MSRPKSWHYKSPRTDATKESLGQSTTKTNNELVKPKFRLSKHPTHDQNALIQENIFFVAGFQWK